MTSNHYETLGVARGAEDAVIRAAYRALMRLYHPDTNADPEAQAKAREITAAFAILGNPAQRAAYDAAGRSDGIGPEGGRWFDEPEHRPPPMRKAGIAAVAVAVVSILAAGLWVAPTPVSVPNAPVRKVAAAETPPPIGVPPAGELAPSDTQPELAEPAVPDLDDLPAPATAERVRSHPRLPEPARPNAAPVTRSAPATLASAERAAPVARRSTPPPKRARPGADGPAQVERMATSFLKQSLAHADWNKQQLLLSAQIRSQTSRNLCRSRDCVTNAYLRQMRETTAIMEGRVPGQ